MPNRNTPRLVRGRRIFIASGFKWRRNRGGTARLQTQSCEINLKFIMIFTVMKRRWRWTNEQTTHQEWIENNPIWQKNFEIKNPLSRARAMPSGIWETEGTRSRHSSTCRSNPNQISFSSSYFSLFSLCSHLAKAKPQLQPRTQRKELYFWNYIQIH